MMMMLCLPSTTSTTLFEIRYSRIAELHDGSNTTTTELSGLNDLDTQTTTNTQRVTRNFMIGIWFYSVYARKRKERVWHRR